jgi:hypothetical protein
MVFESSADHFAHTYCTEELKALVAATRLEGLLFSADLCGS